jgi:hypothetical protein
MLTFEPADHRYFWNQKLVDNVTSILNPLTDYSHIRPDVLARAQQEGKDNHRMASLHCKGDLDEETLPMWLEPKLRGLKKFIADTGFEMIASEQMLYSPTYQIAGTPDIVGPMRSRPGCALIDVKRSLYAGRAIALQLSGYEILWNETYPDNRITEKFALVLGDGDYRLTAFNDPQARNVFLSALVMHRWLANGR